MARKLSDNYKNKVLVIEIGRNRTDDPFVTNPFPTLFPNIASDLTFDPKYAVTYTPEGPNPLQGLIYSEGRMWGGSSAHNYGLAVRGTPSIYDFWAAFSGNSRWLYSNLLSTMKEIETYTPNGTPINTNQRGTSGPVFVTQLPPVVADPLAIGFSLGTQSPSGPFTPFTFDYNDIDEGSLSISAIQALITPDGPNSVRSFSQPAYLPVGTIIDANGNGLDGRRLKILSGAFTSRVLFKGTKAVGLEIIVNVGTSQEKVINVYASKKVILSAGAINTPAILQRSGVGDPALLDPLGIPVVINSFHVGKNLINQYGADGILQNVTADTSVGFINGSPFFPNDATRRIQLIPQFFGPTTTGVLGFNLAPRSRGSVEIVDTNPFIEPKVNLNLYTDVGGYDASVIVAFYKLLQTISANIPGSFIVYPTAADYAGGDTTLLTAAKNSAALVIADHIVGTTRMADSIANGVVDGNLQVFGAQNLMVVDIGVEPQTPDGNTCFSAYVVGNVGAQIVLSGG